MTYASVNDLQMYYEIHGGDIHGGDIHGGAADGGRPLVLLPGALSGIGTSFGAVLPYLAKHRRVIAVELQAHGRTADVDRPLTVAQLAEDVAALLRHLGIDHADLFGYSVGAGVALQVAMAHPALVGKLVLTSVSYLRDGFHPGLLDGIEQLRPEHLAGSPFEQEYLSTAPRPEDWPTLIEKVKQLDRENPDWPAEAVRAVTAPTLLVYGDSDIIRPEHAVEMFRLLGGGVAGDMAGLPRARLAILPGTTHITVMQQGERLAPMVEDFLAQ
jgi:pimeloyl-ACP methyl ester carboxylesterase